MDGVTGTDDLWVSRRPRAEADLDDVLEVIEGIGRMLQSIDARLEKLAAALGGDDEED